MHEFDCGVVATGFTLDALERALRSLTPERIRRHEGGRGPCGGAHNAERNRDVVLELVEAGLAGAR